MFYENEDIKKKIEGAAINIGAFFDDVSKKEQSLMDTIKSVSPFASRSTMTPPSFAVFRGAN